MSASSETELAAQVAVVSAQQQADHDRITDHEARLRLVESAVVALSSLPKLVEDLEGRQRGDERYRYALPLTALTALGSVVATIITLIVK
ncbi:hypothetical protein [Sphaerimonospora mesophila]|uniref:hypothetical protein n=1 Tax=Sphaerimonospora mesophila TaxID=37483 RepID=UPI0006E2DA94